MNDLPGHRRRVDEALARFDCTRSLGDFHSSLHRRSFDVTFGCRPTTEGRGRSPANARLKRTGYARRLAAVR